MGIVYSTYTYGADMANHILYQTYNSTVDNFNKEQNSLFELLQKNKYGITSYNRDDYVRYEFKNRKEMRTFISELSANHFDYVNTAFKMDTGYVVEVKKYSNLGSVVDDFEEKYKIEVNRHYDARTLHTFDRENQDRSDFAIRAVMELQEVYSVVAPILTGIDYMKSWEGEVFHIHSDDVGDIVDVFWKDKAVRILNDDVYLVGIKTGQDGKLAENWVKITDDKLAEAVRISHDNTIKRHKEELNRINQSYAGKSGKTILKARDDEIKDLNNKAYRIHEDSAKVIKTNNVSAYHAIQAENVVDVLRRNLTMENLGVIGSKTHMMPYVTVGNSKLSAREISDALKNDFGFVVSPRITELNLMSLNEELIRRANDANIYLLGKFGKINSKKLLELDASQLKKLGISENSARLFAGLNQKGAYGFNVMKTPPMQVGSLFLRRNLDPDGDVQEVMATARMAKNTIQVSYRQILKSSEQIEMMKSVHRAKRTLRSASAPTTGKTAKVKTPKAKKSKVLSQRQKDKQEIAGRNASAKVYSSLNSKNSNSAGNQILQANNNLKNAIARTSIGKAGVAVQKFFAKLAPLLLKYAAIALGVFVGVAGKILMVLIIISSIPSIFGGIGKMVDKALAPKDYTETVVYNLYSALTEQEQAWIAELQDYEGVYKNRLSLQYGVEYRPFATHIRETDGITADENGTFFVNPFYKNPNLNLGEAGKRTSYGGTKTINILANANTYTVDKTTVNGKEITQYAESGHTSNIKDILAMVDVMYDSQTGLFGDEDIESVLGKSSAQLEWNKFCATVKNFWKFLNGWIFHFFTNNDNWYEEWRENRTIVCDYKTIENYAITLFHLSHQESIVLNYECYDVATGSLRNKYNNKEISWAELALMGVCASPDHLTCKLHRVNGNVRISYDGIYVDDSTSGFETTVKLENITKVNGRTPDTCIWNGMTNNEESYKRVESMLSEGCWSKDTVTEKNVTVKDKGTVVYPESMYDFVVVASTSKDAFPQVLKQSDVVASSKATILMDKMVKNLNLKKNSLSDVYSLTSYYTLNALGNTFVKTSYEIPTDATSDKKYFSFNKNISGYKSLSKEEAELLKGKLTGFTGNISNMKYSNGVLYLQQLKNGIYTTYSIVKVEISNPVKEKKETLTRNCKGHSFDVCLGHIGFSKLGVVYSTTNEQMYIVSGDKSKYYKAVNYDISNTFGTSLIGKIITDGDNAYDNSSVATAITTGSGLYPATSVQGSYATYNSGANLIASRSKDGLFYWDTCKADEETGTLAGMKLKENLSSTVTSKYLLKDIFDIDMMILKGDNLYPTTLKNYLPWTASAMELALIKMTMDWSDLYGFDIPLNISHEQELSFDDKKQILDAIIRDYPDLSEERIKVIETALGYVGHGTYNEAYSHTHEWFCESHKSNPYVNNRLNISVDFTCTCSVGNSLDFVKSVYYMSGIIEDYNSFNPKRSMSRLSSAYTNAMPADILIHSSMSDWQSGYVNAYSQFSVEKARKYMYGAKDKYVIYLGRLSEDLVLTRKMWHKGKPDTTVTYVTIPKGKPLYITLDIHDETSSVSVGTVMLMGYEDKLDVFTKGKLEKKSFSNTFEWVTLPDTRTNVFHLEDAN